MDFDFEADVPQETLATVGAAKTDKRVVCRYWLENRCLKEQDCRFLHMYDLDKFPECKFGSRCTIPDCKFRHVMESDKQECPNYRLGFCSFGASCKFRHVKLPPEALPPIAECWTPEYLAGLYNAEKDADVSSAWHVKECPEYIRLGWCPYFDQCNFAHGQEELRSWKVRAPGGGGGPNGYNRGGFRGGVGGADRGRGREFHGGGGGGGRDSRDSREAGFALGGGGGAGGSSSALPLGGARGGGAPPPPVNLDGAPTLAMLLFAYDNGVAAELEVPDASEAPPSAYYIVRSLDADSLAVSLRRGEWAAPPAAAEGVASALRSAHAVYCFFSIVGSQHFQGVARVRGAPRPASAAEAVFEGAAVSPSSSSQPLMIIPVEWLRTCALPFSHTASLRNAEYGNGVLARAGDWTSLSRALGKAIMLLLYRAPLVDVDVSGLPADGRITVLDPDAEGAAARVAAEDLGPGFEQEHSPNATLQQQSEQQQQGRGGGGSFPQQRGGFGDSGGGGGGPYRGAPPPCTLLNLSDPRLAASRGPPASPFIAQLLGGVQPPATPPPAVLAADALVRGQPGFLFACNNVTASLCMNSGVFAGAEDPRTSEALRSVTTGTPCIMINVHAHEIVGLFLSRGPPIRDLVPGLVPRMGHEKKAFPLHIQVLRAADALPMPNPAFEPLLGPRPQPGPVDAATMHRLAVAMFGTMPPVECLRTAGMLHQMAAMGMPSLGLLPPVAAIAASPADPAVYAGTLAGYAVVPRAPPGVSGPAAMLLQPFCYR